MTDRELLEFAAKAGAKAGMPIIDSEAGPQILVRKTSDGAEHYRLWIPIDDDGDALRLAVKLNIHVLRFSNMTTARTIFSDHCFDERDGGNACAATRRAIVRAAAEIGKAME